MNLIVAFLYLAAWCIASGMLYAIVDRALGIKIEGTQSARAIHTAIRVGGGVIGAAVFLSAWGSS
jgi:hypothetical protein